MPENIPAIPVVRGEKKKHSTSFTNGEQFGALLKHPSCIILSILSMTCDTEPR